MEAEIIDKNAEIISRALNNLLYTEKPLPLDLQGLNEEFAFIAEQIETLYRYAEELKHFATSIADGELEVAAPSRANVFCWSLKSLRSHLLHVVWQADQVAKGDYTQKVDFLGEFSEAFNAMTDQLRQREEHLREEQEKVQRKERALRVSNALLDSIINSMNNGIMIIDKYSRECILWKKIALSDKTYQQEIDAELRAQIAEHSSEDCSMWEVKLKFDNEEIMAFQIDTFFIEWQGNDVVAYLITDVTKHNQRLQEMEDYAYNDLLTNTFNRRYCMKILEEYLASDKTMCVSFIDIDNLKIVNDKFGHLEGDKYIYNVARSLERHFRKEDIICRVGGDEFVIIMKDCKESSAQHRLEKAYYFLKETATEVDYEKAFSYGTVYVDKNNDLSIDDILRQADNKMYACKYLHKLHISDKQKI